MCRFFLILVVLLSPGGLVAASPPNILLVISDDQGFGDLGAHGNPIVKTPVLDGFAKEAVWLKNFYVSPVCSPTRASLLTGLYNYRTGVVDTYLGRSLMRPDVKTLADYLASAGYRTGLFGKWHLGDNYPLRPEDRSFHVTLWHQGGGLAQPSDSPSMDSNSAYFSPVLKANGKDLKTKGYCTDVFTDAAIQFLSKSDGKPFFAYVSFNAPHAPYQVPDELAAPYRNQDLAELGFPRIGQPWITPKFNPDEIAKAYGMIENIDINFGRLLKTLNDTHQTQNTIVLFLTDNGPGGVRWNAGLRNRKGTVYEGGIRVPCYIRWPGRCKAGHVINTALAHIDITPTLLDATGFSSDVKLDGRSFLPQLLDQQVHWPPRTLFFQWHRGDEPEKYRAFAARGPRYKLVQAAGPAPGEKWKPKYELFDIQNDPYESTDLAEKLPKVVQELKQEYEMWFCDVTQTGFEPPRIVVGNQRENPMRLSRQDWRGPQAGWNNYSVGHWLIEVEQAGRYRITLRSVNEFNRWRVALGQASKLAVESRPTRKSVTELRLATGPALLEALVGDETTWRGVHYVELEYLEGDMKK